MSVEKALYFAPELEDAWKREDIQSCYKILASMPDGVNFRVGNLLFELVSSTVEEKELMQLSMEKGKEFGLIKSADKSAIIAGFDSGIDLDDISGALSRTVDAKRPAIFSHTHWDINKHPLPGYADIGFGDIPLFNIFIREYPLLECRAVFNSGNTVRSIVYKGQVK